MSNIKPEELAKIRETLDSQFLPDPYFYVQSAVEAYDLLNSLESEAQNHPANVETAQAKL